MCVDFRGITDSPLCRTCIETIRLHTDTRNAPMQWSSRTTPSTLWLLSNHVALGDQGGLISFWSELGCLE
ncbi:jg14718 [Pararge aegeria aegeria]|uniref:Jg14718 protein n=1 Tax=Pararge aegeria aegeria TaxID=348720 RepID=A0A8S4SDM1_9NEOP|nr:jg14718 [Pararge aegeria aegeria]